MGGRLIDVDALKRAFCNHCDGDEPCTEPCVDIGLIETEPTVDAVPVVRCEECKNLGNNDGYYFCNAIGLAFGNKPNWFCADGERRTE